MGRGGSDAAVQTGSGPSTRRLITVAALCLYGAFVLAWALIGDLAEVPESADPDRMIQAPDLSSGVETALVVTAVLALVGIVGVIVSTGTTDRPGSVRALVLVTVLGAYLGFLGRAVTAEVIGANIGAGMLLLLVTPWLVPLLSIVAFRQGRRPTGRAMSRPRLAAVGCTVVLLTGACGTDATADPPVTEPPRRAETLDEATLEAQALAVLLADTAVSDPLGGDDLRVVDGHPVHDEEGLIGWSLEIAVPGTGERDAVWLGTRCESDGRIVINRSEATLRPPVTVIVSVDVDTSQVIHTHIPPQTTVPGDDERPVGGVRTGDTFDRIAWTGRQCDPDAPTD